MKSLVAILVISLLFISCGYIIEINGNGYRSLKKQSKDILLPYNSHSVAGKFYEIGSNDIESIIKMDSSCLFVFYMPSCSAFDRLSFADVIKKYGSKLKVYFISREYALNEMKLINDGIEHKIPYFILKDSDFGYKIKKANIRLNRIYQKYNSDLIQFSENNFFDFVIFKSAKLVKISNSLDELF